MQSAPTKRGTDYRIPDGEEIGAGGDRTRYRDNVAALRTLKAIEAAGRQATPEEQQILSRYCGWGWTGNGLFNEENDPRYDGGYRPRGNEWKEQYRELQELLTPEEFSAARASVTNAHFTALPVVRALWDAVRHLGFTGGRVLEPGCGSGNFIGAMPAALWQDSSVCGVEIDSLTSRIAQQLYQSAFIENVPFQETTLPDGFFDLAIGNVPFQEAAGIFDRAYDKPGLKFVTNSLHNYFFAKSLDKLKDGGVLCLLTSRYTMDSPKAQRFRQYLAERTDFLGAMRLPETAFKNAGTDVVTDVLFLRKRAPGESPAEGPAFAQVSKTGWGSNEYFVDFPEMVLGRFSVERRGMYRDRELTVKDDGRDLAASMRAMAAKFLPRDIVTRPVIEGSTAAPEIASTIEAARSVGRLPGSYFLQDGQLFQQTATEGVQAVAGTSSRDKSLIARVRAMIPVKDAVRSLLETMADPLASTDDVTAGQSALKRTYDGYVRLFGHFHERTNVSILSDDPDLPLLLALEHWDEKAKKATPAAIFTERTVSPHIPAGRASSPQEAMIHSLAERGTLDFEHMGRLLGREPLAVATDLEQSGQVFHDPAGSEGLDGYQAADAYLSGNVRTKLKQAAAAARFSPRYEANVAALRAVQPRDLQSHEITVGLGAGWVGEKTIQDFVHHLLDIPAHATKSFGVTAKYIESLGKWILSEPAYSHMHSTRARQTWGTPDVPAHELVSLALNFERPRVFEGTGDKRVFSEDLTKLATMKQDAIKAEFAQWVWGDPARAAELTAHYNERFNADRVRTWDGSHLTFPGLSSAITPSAHQRDAVWRALQSKSTLFGHVVGAGKSIMKIITAMEMRRLGIAKKPMITVPNHVVPQISAEFRRCYPNANVLMVTARDFEKSRRRELMAKIATGNWDAVVIAHSQFTRIPVTEETERTHREAVENELERVVDALRSEAADPTEQRTVKQLEKTLARMKEKTRKRLTQRKEQADDGMVRFEHLGVDQLLVDEFQEFKNLEIITGLKNVKGLPSTGTGSNRAFDMAMKVALLQQRNNGRGLVSATGTPLTNSIAEMYVMQKYHDPDGLQAMGLGNFDAWVHQYGDLQLSNEVTATGKIKPVERFARFVNVPELGTAFRTFAEIKTREDLKLPVPIAEHVPVLCTESDHQAQNTLHLQSRADSLDPRHPEVDNMLKIVSDAKKNLLDARLVQATAPDNASGKINRCVDNLHQEYHRNAQHNATQLVFLDLSTPKPADLRERPELPEDAIESDITPEERLRRYAGAIRHPGQRAYAGAYGQWLTGGQQGERPNAAEYTGVEDEAAEAITSDMETEWDGLSAADTALRDSLYHELREKLVRKGIPREQIAFIHEADNEAKKTALQDAMNAGRVRILLGSTSKMGTGLNVQKRMSALHHLDCPWRPADLEQRNGRILRQGNMFQQPENGGTIRIYSYLGVSADKQSPTMDAFLWQKIQSKQQAISQIMRGDPSLRTVQDISDEELTPAQYKAMTSGNPLLSEQLGLEHELRNLESGARAHEIARSDAQARRAHTPLRVMQESRYVQQLDEALAHHEASVAAQGADSTGLWATIDGQSFENRDKAGTALLVAIARAEADHHLGHANRVHLGSVNGFDVEWTKPGGSHAFLLLSPDHAKARVGEAATLSVDLSDTPAGIIERIRNRIRGLRSAREEHQGRLDQLRKDLVEQERADPGDYPHTERLHQVRTRLREIDRHLSGNAPAQEPVAKSLSDEEISMLNLADVAATEGVIVIVKGMSYYGGKWSGESEGARVSAADRIKDAASSLWNRAGAPSAIRTGMDRSGMVLRQTPTAGPSASVYHAAAADGATAVKGLRAHLRRQGYSVGATERSGFGSGQVRTEEGGTERIGLHRFTATDRNGGTHTFHVESRPWMATGADRERPATMTNPARSIRDAADTAPKFGTKRNYSAASLAGLTPTQNALRGVDAQREGKTQVGAFGETPSIPAPKNSRTMSQEARTRNGFTPTSLKQAPARPLIGRNGTAWDTRPKVQREKDSALPSVTPSKVTSPLPTAPPVTPTIPASPQPATPSVTPAPATVSTNPVGQVQADALTPPPDIHKIASGIGLKHLASIPPKETGQTKQTGMQHYFAHRNPQNRLLRLRDALSKTHDTEMIHQKPIRFNGADRHEFSFTATPKGGGEAHTFRAARDF